MSLFGPEDLAGPARVARLSRRALLAAAAAAPWASISPGLAAPTTHRVRPGDPDWPNAAAWRALGERLQGALEPVSMPDLSGPAGARLASNPYYIGEQPALTQSSGWIDAWQSAPSPYVVRAKSAQDVSTALGFAARRRIRVAVRGGAHSYLGRFERGRIAAGLDPIPGRDRPP